MSGALTLIIFVAVGEADDATSRAMTRATRTALGSQAQVELRETSEPPSDADALATERGAHADAVIELTWADPAHRQAVVRVHVARTDRWFDRTIGFEPSDADVERGRTIGFAVASMLPDAAPPTAGTDASAPGGPSNTAIAAIAAPLGPASSEVPASAAPPVVAEARAAPPPATRAGRVSLDVLGAGSVGFGGDADALGASGAVQWLATPRVALRIGGGARAGSVDAAQATTLALVATGGVVLYLLPPSSTRPLGVWARADYVLEHQSMTHFSGDDPAPATIDRWMSGVDALAGGELWVASQVAIVAAVGYEDVFSPTYVQVRGVPVATIPPLRGVAEAGFRLRF